MVRYLVENGIACDLKRQETDYWSKCGFCFEASYGLLTSSSI